MVLGDLIFRSLRGSGFPWSADNTAQHVSLPQARGAVEARQGHALAGAGREPYSVLGEGNHARTEATNHERTPTPKHSSSCAHLFAAISLAHPTLSPYRLKKQDDLANSLSSPDTHKHICSWMLDNEIIRSLGPFYPTANRTHAVLPDDPSLVTDPRKHLCIKTANPANTPNTETGWYH